MSDNFKVFFHDDLGYSHYSAVVVEVKTTTGGSLFFSCNEKNRMKVYESYPKPYWRIKSTAENLGTCVLSEDKKTKMGYCLYRLSLRTNDIAQEARKFHLEISNTTIDEIAFYLHDLNKKYKTLFSPPKDEEESTKEASKTVDLSDGWEPFGKCDNPELLDIVFRGVASSGDSIFTHDGKDYRFSADKIFVRASGANSAKTTPITKIPSLKFREKVKMALSLADKVKGVSNITGNMLYEYDYRLSDSNYLVIVDDFGNQRSMSAKRFLIVDVYKDALERCKENKK